jgi:N4-gp56 family major capsid protein
MPTSYPNTSTVSTQVADNANYLHLYYEKKLLSTLEPRLVLMPLGRKQRLPKGNGKQVKWLRYAAIGTGNVINAASAAITSYGSELTEGQIPDATAFQTSSVTAEVKQYGQFARVADMLSDVAIDPVLENLSERFGIAASKTIEELIVQELRMNAAIQQAGTASPVADVLSHKELVEAMISQKAAFIGPHESGEYLAVLHPRSEYDLITDVNSGSWLDIHKGVDNKPLLNGEIGRMYGMRFLVSDKMPTEVGQGAAGKDVCSSFVIGEEAFGVVELNGDAMKMFVKRQGSAGTADPLDQFATVGYKIHGFAVKYLDAGSKRVIRIRSTSNL